MKTTIMTMAMLLFATVIFAQERVKEKDVLGTWKFKIDIRDAVKEEAKDMGFFEGMMAKAVSGMVEDIMEEIDITFDFQKNNVVYLTVVNDIEERETETEKLHWEIDEDGSIRIDDIDNDNVQIQNDGYWVLADGKLIAYEKDGTIEKNAWMERVK
ncbi:hypothetical protein [Robertkochia flava]|uniref:hypothetical protein n=1 Tax=Robertkochia flava TaxID=3447986 RepID=UPI001CCB5E35|nr:hypothetical protein [Robertkochia marina]